MEKRVGPSTKPRVTPQVMLWIREIWSGQVWSKTSCGHFLRVQWESSIAGGGGGCCCLLFQKQLLGPRGWVEMSPQFQSVRGSEKVIYCWKKLLGVTGAVDGDDGIKPGLYNPQSFCIRPLLFPVCLFVNSQSRGLEPPLKYAKRITLVVLKRGCGWSLVRYWLLIFLVHVAT